MLKIDLLRLQSQASYEDVLTAIDGVTEHQSWAVLPEAGNDYLHTDGTIHGLALHIATGKFIYGSTAFRNTEVRWRDCAERIGGFEPNWASAVEYLKESHAYWMSTWADLTDEDLEREVPRFRGELWPAWKIINTIIQHDAYHAGQIAVLRYGCPETDKHPPSVAEDIRKYCSALPGW